MFNFGSLAKMKYVSRVGMSITALAILMILLFSCYSQSVGSYTIELSEPIIGNKMMILSETKEFIEPVTSLYAEPVNKALPIGIRGKPEAEPLEISSIQLSQDGSNNGQNYFAYTFYTKNIGTESLDYNLKLYITEAEKNVEEAIRVKIIITEDYFGEKNVKEAVYAKAQSQVGINPGMPEVGTIPFYNANIVVNQNRFEFEVDTVDQYIILMWLHGEDLDCTDVGENSIVNGKLSMSMKFNILA